MAEGTDFNVQKHPLMEYLDGEIERRMSGGTGGSGLDARVAKLEEAVDGIKTNTSEIKTDLRRLLGGILGAYVAIAGAYLLTANKLDSLGDKINALTVRIEQTVLRQTPMVAPQGNSATKP
jgi:hypothetical protein